MAQISPMCKLNSSEIANCESVTESELAEELDHDAKRAYALQKGHFLENKSGIRSARFIRRKVGATVGTTNEGKTFINEEPGILTQIFTMQLCLLH